MSDTENTNGEEMEQPATTGTSSQQNNTVSNMANAIPSLPSGLKPPQALLAILRQIGSDSKDHGRITR